MSRRKAPPTFEGMKLKHGVMTSLATVLVASLAYAAPAQAQSATAAPDNASIDVNQLFATTCGWCHSDGGRTAGKGPQGGCENPLSSRFFSALVRCERRPPGGRHFAL